MRTRPAVAQLVRHTVDQGTLLEVLLLKNLDLLVIALAALRLQTSFSRLQLNSSYSHLLKPSIYSLTNFYIYDSRPLCSLHDSFTTIHDSHIIGKPKRVNSK